MPRRAGRSSIITKTNFTRGVYPLMSPIRQREVLNVVLLQTLATNPDGIRVSEVNDLISESYTFPDEWYRELPDSAGYDALKAQGYADWRAIPQATLIELVKTEPQWKNEIRWARNELRKLHFLDTSAPRGLWRLTTTGMTAARNPQAHIELTDREQEIATPRPVRQRTTTTHAASGPTPQMSERERLLAALTQLVDGLPVRELELVVDIARVVRRRNLPDVPPAT